MRCFRYSFTHKITDRKWWFIRLFFISILVSSVSSAHDILFVGEPVPPLILTDQNQQKSGALVEVAKALIMHTRVEASIVFLPWARAYEMGLHKPNVILLSLLKTKRREPLFQWIGEVHQAKAHLIGLKNRTDIRIADLQQAKRLRVGSIRGYGSANYLVTVGFDEKSNLVLSSRSEQLWGLLYNGRIDLVLSNYETSSFEISKAGFDPALVIDILEVTALNHPLYFATGFKTAPPLVTTLSRGLVELKQNGTYATIMHKWGLQPD